MGLFSSAPHHDDVLGELARKSGWWTGRLELSPHGLVPVRVAGGRSAPDAASIAVARSVATVYRGLSAEIETALYEHYLPGLESWRAGEMDDLGDAFPQLAAANEVWENVRVESVDVDAGARDYSVEVRLESAWDVEHTLGVRIAGETLVELCGSVGP